MLDQDRFLTIFFGLLTLISLILILTNIPKAIPQGSRAIIDNNKIVLLPSYNV